jgi:hypothetical protein
MCIKIDTCGFIELDRHYKFAMLIRLKDLVGSPLSSLKVKKCNPTIGNDNLIFELLQSFSLTKFDRRTLSPQSNRQIGDQAIFSIGLL